MKFVCHFIPLLLVGCATATVDEDAVGAGGTSLPEFDEGMGGESMMGSGGTKTVLVTGSGGVTTSSGGGGLVGAESGGAIGSGGGLIGGNTGGTSSGGSASTGGASTGGTLSTGGTSSTGGSSGSGSPAECLLGWAESASATACLNAGQDDRVVGCTEALNCWQTNDCTAAECGKNPDDTCGQNKVQNYQTGLTYANTVFAALCN